MPATGTSPAASVARKDAPTAAMALGFPPIDVAATVPTTVRSASGEAAITRCSAPVRNATLSRGIARLAAAATNTSKPKATVAPAPVPWALVVVPFGPAVALALVTAAVPVAASALSMLRRPDPAAQLRAEAG